jgi:hypothetical protein
MTFRRLLIALAFSALVVTPTAAARVGATPAAAKPDGGDAHAGMRLAWSLPDGPTRTHSDIAFWGDLGVAGNYDGFRVFNKRTHQLYVSYLCRGPQDDVSLWRYQGRMLLFLSVDRPQVDGATVCGQSSSTDTTASDPRGWEGIRIFDITNPASPVYLHAVRTDCGSHTHTLIPDLANNRLLIYVSSFPIASQNIGGTCQQPFGKFSIVSVPLSAPETAHVIAQPPISAPPYSGAVACHDITVFLSIHKAAASCMSEGQIWDISDPANPDTLHAIHIDNASVWFWHSAEFTWDGQYVVFDDEGTGNCGGSNGRIWIYRTSDGAFQSSFMIPRPQGGSYCSVHNGNFIPVSGRYLLTAAWYSGGTSVVDLTNPTAPRELAYYDAVTGRGAADTWSSYWYNGAVYANDMTRGIDAFNLVGSVSSAGATWGHLNAQTQENLIAFPIPGPGIG